MSDQSGQAPTNALPALEGQQPDADRWLPTAANINAADPSGETRERVIARDTARALEVRVQELEADVSRLKAERATFESCSEAALVDASGRLLDAMAENVRLREENSRLKRSLSMMASEMERPREEQR